MGFRFRVEVLDEERGSRVEGFEIRFESRTMVEGLVNMVKKNASFAGREVGELGELSAPAEAPRPRSKILERLAKKSTGGEPSDLSPPERKTSPLLRRQSP